MLVLASFTTSWLVTSCCALLSIPGSCLLVQATSPQTRLTVSPSIARPPAFASFLPSLRRIKATARIAGTTLPPKARFASQTALHNIYDDWRNDLLSSANSACTYEEFILPLDEEMVEQCLEEFMDSEYGTQMFGRHERAASVGITGSIELASLEGPEAILGLRGKFWHRRETVLGRAAMYLNARIPELTSVTASSAEELQDFENVVDEYTGELLYVDDKRSPDFNGDRETMEYQGIDPDVRGPFVGGGGFGGGGGGSMILPA